MLNNFHLKFRMILLDQLLNLYEIDHIRGTLKAHVYYSVTADEVTNFGVFKILVNYREESNCTRIVLRFKSYVW